jgi:alkyl sulfatase BDS1-like metallo-beta-lactamase superfamily hydrolase
MAGGPDEKWVLALSNRTLRSIRGRHQTDADVSLRLDRALLLRIIAQETSFVDEIASGRIAVEGDAGALLTIFGNLDVFMGGFAIVEP